MHTLIGIARAMVAAAVFVALASCGGGGGSSAPPLVGAGAQSCSVNNPYRADATSPTTLGNLGTEKTWLRDYVDHQYLWYSEVPNVNASAAAFSNESDVFTSLDNYFNALLTPARTDSDKLKDQFSFIYPTAAWDQLINSGSTVGYGIEWHFASPTPPRGIRVAYVHAGSTAFTNGIQRGDTLVLADNVSADDNTPTGVGALNNALFPAAGTSHGFRFSRAGNPFDVTMTAGNVALNSVEQRVLSVNGQNVGYLLFNDHVLTAEQPLINAVQALKNANVTDLVLDLRYNGGGYLYIASELAYMIAGAAPTANKVFESTVFSDKRANENAATGFFNVACVPDVNFQCTSSAPLPTLNLSRVFVLTSGGTCSASEAIVNGLRGVNIDVHLIGGATCGKPYGFFGQDNCGISYFPIEFQGVNDKGFGDYADGFIPGGTGAGGNNVPGCAANDDLDHPLGDPAEGQLAAALFHRGSSTSACLPVMVSQRAAPLAAGRSDAVALGRVIKPSVLINRNARMPAR